VRKPLLQPPDSKSFRLGGWVVILSHAQIPSSEWQRTHTVTEIDGEIGFVLLIQSIDMWGYGLCYLGNEEEG